MLFSALERLTGGPEIDFLSPENRLAGAGMDHVCMAADELSRVRKETSIMKDLVVSPSPLRDPLPPLPLPLPPPPPPPAPPLTWCYVTVQALATHLTYFQGGEHEQPVRHVSGNGSLA